MATFTRPAAPTCEGFAALAPQLQTLAEAVESDLQTISTAEIFKALDMPFLSLLKTSTDPIGASPVQQPVSFDTGFAIVEATNNGGIIQGTATGSSLPEAMVLPSSVQPRWYYIGYYLSSPTNAVDQSWKVNLFVDDVDPITGINNSQRFTRMYTTPAVLHSPDEYIWADFMVSSRGGGVIITATIDSGPTQDIDGGRCWAMQIAPKR